MNMPLEISKLSKSKHLTAEQTEEFGRRVEEIRQQVMQNLGQKDAEYIYKIRNFVRYSEISSRAMLMFCGLVATGMAVGYWVAGSV